MKSHGAECRQPGVDGRRSCGGLPRIHSSQSARIQLFGVKYHRRVHRNVWAAFVLCVPVILTAGCERSARVVSPTAHAQASGCPAAASGDKVRIREVRAEEDRKVMAVDPNPELGGEASLMWRGDLNKDGQDDVMLRFFELCGNEGECPWAVYAGCGEDRFVTVWGPDYSVQLEVSREGSEQGWADLERTVRITTRKTDNPSKQTLRFDKGAYRTLRGSEKRVR